MFARNFLDLPLATNYGAVDLRRSLNHTYSFARVPSLYY